ncbi:nuclear transport factor 2 family protein [Saccharibacillus sp. CPCC 101409]|uniref:nuclear transport factor 2 family protein n=1 Tax=Saccharibacillus sp. CPCC 101409 TaxID=3058041 RepID=UPI002672F70F|nr:nuclear transport factor 2 family protein [Saccharibacillus sp. CPCC 101409]MDO3412233.1 nuclear transport factor 2 family protein [Saccharibacillus sp. CPCC 101409]
MSLETFQAQFDLRILVDSYATLTDEKKIAEQMLLFTPDVQFDVYMGGQLVSQVSGTQQLEQEFNGHVSLVKQYFTLNGQHVVQVDGDRATGIVFSQMKMLREQDGEEVLTDYSVKYNDVYVKQNGAWLIGKRTSEYTFIESRVLNHMTP